MARGIPVGRAATPGTGLVTWLLRLGLADSIPGLVLAHLMYVLPYVVLTLVPVFGDRLRQLEEAAATLGRHGGDGCGW